MFSLQIHEDLEKDPDYSGSGLGPDDDEDSETRSKPTSHHTNSGANGGEIKFQQIDIFTFLSPCF